MNFSATQEIDRQQQIDKAKISTLETENQELKAKNTEIENKVSTLEAKIQSIHNEMHLH